MQEQAQKLLADMVLLYHRACNKMSLVLLPRTSQGFCRSCKLQVMQLGRWGPMPLLLGTLKEHRNSTLQQAAQAPNAQRQGHRTACGMVQGKEREKKDGDLGAS